MAGAAMAYGLKAAGAVADIGSVGSLLNFTGTVLRAITRLAGELDCVPDVIASAKEKVGLWEIHLKSLCGISERERINEHLRRVLQGGGVLGRAQKCLERLNDIVTEATPREGAGRSRFSELYDHLVFRLGTQDEVQDLLRELDTLTQDLGLAMKTNLTDAIEALTEAIHQKALAEVKDEEADAIIHWLTPNFEPRNSDPDSMQVEKFSHQEPETCTWMTESATWKDWLRGGSDAADGCRRFMWISGLPGTGKTILASFLIRTLGPYQSTHYYCLHERRQDETLPFLRWTVRDLYKQLKYLDGGAADRRIPTELREMWQHNRLSIESLMECLKVLVGQFHSQHKKRVYIVVDAIDESLEPRDRLLDILTTIGVSSKFKHVSLLMTSRPHPDIERAIKDLEPITLRPDKLKIRSFRLSHDLPPPSSGHRNLDSSPEPIRRGGAYPGRVINQETPTQSSLETGNTPTSGRLFSSGNLETLNQGIKRPLPGAQDYTSPTKKPRQSAGISPCTTLDMDNPHVLESIRIYVQQRLEKNTRFRRWSHPDLVDVETALARKAGGIFRIVACHFDMIQRYDMTEPLQVMKCINTMPDSIFASYEKILVEGIRDGGELNQPDREFARTALALICSDTSQIPDAEVLIEASQTILSRLIAKNYDRTKLANLLGCLVKENFVPWQKIVFPRKAGDEVAPPTSRISVAHYTVKEFLISDTAAKGPAKFFAVSALSNQRLELKIVFYGLQHFDPNPRGASWTRFEEYCLKLTEKALTQRPAIVEEEEIWDAVKPCLRANAPHAKRLSKLKNAIKTSIPKWSSLSPFADDGGPTLEATSILVNLLILEWPELARVYLQQLESKAKRLVWHDEFELMRPNTRAPTETCTLAQMCVSRRRLDFLKIFTYGVDGARFRQTPDILFRAMNDPNPKDDSDSRLVTEELLKELLAYSADPNPEGFLVTPLQYATHSLQPMWVRHLLASGAKVTAVGECSGVDSMSLTDESGGAPRWCGYRPLRICRHIEINGIDGEHTDEDMHARLGVEAQLRRYVDGEVRQAPLIQTQPTVIQSMEAIVLDDSDHTIQ